MIEDKFKDIITLSEAELKVLGDLSRGFSGFEISNLINEVLIENCDEENQLLTEVI